MVCQLITEVSEILSFLFLMPMSVQMLYTCTWEPAGHEVTYLCWTFFGKRMPRKKIVNWIRRKFNACAAANSLEDVAQAYTVKVEKILAASTHSRMSGTFYGQWLVLHVPFHSPLDLIGEELLRKVPVAHHCFTAAMYCEHRVAVAMWTNDDTIEHELMIEGHTERHSDAILAMVHATRSLITDYVAGRLDVAEEEMRAAEEVQLAPEQIEEAQP